MNLDHRPYHDSQPGSQVSGNLAAPRDPTDRDRPEFTLLVAGCRGGKTSFLRMLLDTSNTARSTTPEQLQSVAKFVQGSSSHTSFIRTASIDLDIDPTGNGTQHLALTIVDTPSLDFRDTSAAERGVQEIARCIESRFAEALEDERKAKSGERFMHLCIYFLDPDQIVPPPTPGPPLPVIPRARTNSFTQPEAEALTLEPPLAQHNVHPAVPPADITTIKHLSQRVNVLPVISRADVLTNDRLTAIKLAVRRDLAAHGIGFGIFDIDNNYQLPFGDLAPKSTGQRNGYQSHPNGSASAGNSPPMSPTASPIMRLPYALIAPDMYSHSDGVPRKSPSRRDLISQYVPSNERPPPNPVVRGKFVRNYRWGALDVLDPTHSDFLHLRAAIFHHMETLQKYTREYLFENFKVHYLEQRPNSRHSLPQQQHRQSPISHHGQHIHQNSRPILAIDTTSPSSSTRHPSLQLHRELPKPDDFRMDTMSGRSVADMPSVISGKGNGQPSAKQRSKKITVACNFCRSRKLKCDGGRPACGQCVKRSNPCDYQVQNKRRGTLRSKDSDSDSEEEKSVGNDPSFSPEVSSTSLSRRSSNVESGFPASLLSADEPPSTSRSKLSTMNERRPFYLDNELPHIATLSLPERSPTTPVPMSAPSFPPIRPASDHQAAQRKRASTVPGKMGRQSQSSGQKVVACNFCRARKTKCDGVHPACSSCARRSLDCNYVHDSPGGSAKKPHRRVSNAKPLTDSPSSPPSSRMAPTPASANNYYLDPRDDPIKIETEFDSKRTMDHPDARPTKKMRMDEDMPMPMVASIP